MNQAIDTSIESVGQTNPKEPLVSIIVITYNSDKYVLETLESIKNQTYENIELIVSDDCSTDETVKVCRNWIKDNQKRFVRTELIENEINTGIAPNCNRGFFEAKGKWVKLIAGDDMLINSCICDNIDYISKNKGSYAVFSSVKPLYEKDINYKEINTLPLEEQKKWYNINFKVQYNRLIEGNFNWAAPSSFLNLRMVRELKGFNEDFPMLEDYPFWLKLTKSGIPLKYFDKVTVLYRQNYSLTRNPNKWINKGYFLSKKNHFMKEIKPVLKSINKKKCRSKMLYYNKMQILISIFGNKKSTLALIFNKCYDKIFYNYP